MNLRPYQKRISEKASELLKSKGIAYLAMAVRTGKTLTALETARLFGAQSVLFITKLKTIPSIKADYALLQKSTPLYGLEVVNHESAHKFIGRSFDVVVVDEAHCLGAYPKPTQKAKKVREVCANSKAVLLLSGTPTPESYSQLYHQFWISPRSPFAAYKNFYRWAKYYVDVYQRRVNGCAINDYSHADEIAVKNVVGEYMFTFTQADAGFLSEIEETDVECRMSDRTARYIRTLKRDRVLNLDEGGVVLGDTPAKLMSKLHQLSGGSVIDEDGIHHITDYAKAQLIKRHFHGKRIAVFYNFQTELELLQHAFPINTDSPEVFQSQEGNDIVFISQIRRAREGVRLDSADAVIFFNPEFSYLSYEQGRNRIMSRERQSAGQVYFLVSDCGIEKDILEAVRGKSDFTFSWYRKHGGV